VSTAEQDAEPDDLIGRPDGHELFNKPLIGRPDGHELDVEEGADFLRCGNSGSADIKGNSVYLHSQNAS